VFLLIDVVNGTLGVLLEVPQDNDVIVSKLASVNLKFTCNISVQILLMSHVVCSIEFKLFESFNDEFVSYKDKETSGLDLIDEQIN